MLPVHNEVENLRWLLPHAADVLPTIAVRYDVVIVDDGSTDGSGAAATALAAELGLRLTIVRHKQKSGYGATVGDGLRAATGDFVAFTDADGQFEIADIAGSPRFSTAPTWRRDGGRSARMHAPARSSAGSSTPWSPSSTGFPTGTWTAL